MATRTLHNGCKVVPSFPTRNDLNDVTAVGVLDHHAGGLVDTTIGWHQATHILGRRNAQEPIRLAFEDVERIIVAKERRHAARVARLTAWADEEGHACFDCGLEAKVSLVNANTERAERTSEKLACREPTCVPGLACTALYVRETTTQPMRLSTHTHHPFQQPPSAC